MSDQVSLQIILHQLRLSMDTALERYRIPEESLNFFNKYVVPRKSEIALMTVEQKRQLKAKVFECITCLRFCNYSTLYNNFVDDETLIPRLDRLYARRGFEYDWRFIQLFGGLYGLMKELQGFE